MQLINLLNQLPAPSDDSKQIGKEEVVLASLVEMCKLTEQHLKLHNLATYSTIPPSHLAPGFLS